VVTFLNQTILKTKLQSYHTLWMLGPMKRLLHIFIVFLFLYQTQWLSTMCG